MNATKKRQSPKDLTNDTKRNAGATPHKLSTKSEVGSKRDDLIQISGIGPITEMALNALGICRFCDFAGYTPKSLAEELQGRLGVAIPESTIADQDWIGEASALASESRRSSARSGAKMPGAANKLKVSAMPATATAPAAPSEAQSITEAAAFAGEQPALPSSTKQIEADPADTVPVRISAARFFPIITGHPSNRMIMAGEIECLLSESFADQSNWEKVSLCLSIWATDLESGEAELLASHSLLLRGDRLQYSVQVRFAAPKAGRHKLQVAAYALQDALQLTLHQGPIVRVEADRT